MYGVRYSNKQAWQDSLRLLAEYERAHSPGILHDTREYALVSTCFNEEVPAVRWNLQQALELPYTEFEPLFSRKIPGPIFRGAKPTLLWLKSKFEQEGIRCEVRRLPWQRIKDLERF